MAKSLTFHAVRERNSPAQRSSGTETYQGQVRIRCRAPVITVQGGLDNAAQLITSAWLLRCEVPETDQLLLRVCTVGVTYSAWCEACRRSLGQRVHRLRQTHRHCHTCRPERSSRKGVSCRWAPARRDQKHIDSVGLASVSRVSVPCTCRTTCKCFHA